MSEGSEHPSRSSWKEEEGRKGKGRKKKIQFVVLKILKAPFRLEQHAPPSLASLTTSTSSSQNTSDGLIHNPAVQHPHVLGATSSSTFPPSLMLLLLLLGARTSVNESRSTRTALLHAISPDLSGREIERKKEGEGVKIPLKAKICHRSLICWKTITKYVKCAKKDGGVRRESIERIPLGSQCEGEEEGGG